MSFYLWVLALGDLVVLWCFVLPKIIHTIFSIDIINLHNVLRWLLNALFQTGMLFSVCVLLFITIERFVAVTLPHKLNIIFTHRQAYISVVLILVLALCFSIHAIFPYKVITHSGIQVCWLTKASFSFIFLRILILGSCTFCILSFPFVS